jgi:hypothetical protein
MERFENIFSNFSPRAGDCHPLWTNFKPLSKIIGRDKRDIAAIKILAIRLACLLK